MNREIKFRVYDYDMEKMRYLDEEHDFICFSAKGNGYYHNIISKYVRMKNGKLQEHFDRVTNYE